MNGRIGKRLIDSLEPQAKPYEVWDTETPGFVLRVRSNGLMTYFLSYRRPDRRKTKVLIGKVPAISAVQARDQARILLAQVTQGIDPSREKKKQTAASLKSFLEVHYKPWVETHRKSAQYTLGRIQRCFPSLMDTPLQEISSWTIERWRSARINDGIQHSTLNRDITSLKAALNKAAEWELISANPILKVKSLKEDKSPIIRFLSSDEEERLRSALEKREEKQRSDRRNRNKWCEERGYDPLPGLDHMSFTDHLKPLVLLSINTGLRRGELTALRWEQIQLNEEPQITVLGSGTKNSSTRYVPLNSEGREVFRLWNQQHNSPHSGWVFPSDSSQGHLTELKTAWNRLLKEAQIQNFRWHDLRHHFASALVIRGVDLNTVRELLGHGDLKMTLRYAHLSPRVKADAVAKLGTPYSGTFRATT
jgi:integrase